MSKGCSKSYHHGDLRNALIMAAVELIEENGTPEFSISEAAKRAGVSPAAPYRHFKHRDDLLEAVAELYFIGLADAAMLAREQSVSGSTHSILCLGRTYVNYLTQRPAFYKLMWNQGEVGHDKRQSAERRPGFDTFVGAVADWCLARSLTETDALDLAIKLWAMAHGLAALSMNGQLEPYMPGADVLEMLDSSATAFLDGIEAETKAQGTS